MRDSVIARGSEWVADLTDVALQRHFFADVKRAPRYLEIPVLAGFPAFRRTPTSHSTRRTTTPPHPASACLPGRSAPALSNGTGATQRSSQHVVFVVSGVIVPARSGASGVLRIPNGGARMRLSLVCRVVPTTATVLGVLLLPTPTLAVGATGDHYAAPNHKITTARAPTGLAMP
jgi:hypothetical protein